MLVQDCDEVEFRRYERKYCVPYCGTDNVSVGLYE